MYMKLIHESKSKVNTEDWSNLSHLYLTVLFLKKIEINFIKPYFLSAFYKTNCKYFFWLKTFCLTPKRKKSVTCKTVTRKKKVYLPPHFKFKFQSNVVFFFKSLMWNSSQILKSSMWMYGKLYGKLHEGAIRNQPTAIANAVSI